MPRLTNPRKRGSGMPRVTLPRILKVVAAVGLIVETVLLSQGGAVWAAVQVAATGLAAALFWYVMARVVEQLDGMTEALERMAEQ